MQSLKELRAQNAARQELSRTTATPSTAATAARDAVSGTTQSPLVSNATTTIAASRPGRTLAPLARSPTSGSTEANRGGGGGGGGGGGRDALRAEEVEQRDDSKSTDDINPPYTGTTRQRRRPKKETEQNSDAAAMEYEVATVADKEQPAVDKVAVDRGITGGVSAKDSATMGDHNGQSQSQRWPKFGHDDTDGRGAPPQEKPKNKLTPLAARRARMEQQKREEVMSTPFQYTILAAAG